MKAIILARVSTKEQEDGHSLNAQRQRLVEYCQRKGFTVIKAFELIESSTRGERKEFQAMLEFAQRQKETIAIVADAVDRVQRGFKESVQLDELVRKEQIELHFYRENMVIGKKASASDVMRWDFSVMGAKSYVLQLSENVKRSAEYKRNNGEWAGPSPLGYLNDRDVITKKATIVLDPNRHYLVKRIFEEYATGLYSINEMTRHANGWGFRNKSGKKLVPNQVHKVLTNPFYYGQMLVNGRLYPHRYDTIIDRNLFDQCEAVRLSKNTKTKAVKQTKNEFMFRSLLTCAVSGRKVTCDLKKGQYVYLICRDPHNPEKKLFVPENKILDQVEDVFKKLRVPEALVELLTKHLQKSHEAEKEFQHTMISSLQRQLTEAQKKKDRLLDLLINGSITQDIYDTKMPLLKQEHTDAKMALDNYDDADDAFKITVSSVLLLLSKAHALFKSSKNEQKRRLINFLFSNLKLNGQTLEYSLRSPFDWMVNAGHYEEWLPSRTAESNQSYSGVRRGTQGCALVL